MPRDARPRDPRAEALAKLLEDYARIAIVGGPRTGKSMLADLVDDRPVIHTDRFVRLPWAEIPGAILAQCSPIDRYLIEGVMVARALRAGLIVDAVLYLDDAKTERSKAHASMTKAVATVFRDWRDANPIVHVVSPDRGI